MTTRLGAIVSVRPLSLDDSAGYLELMRALVADGAGMVLDADELPADAGAQRDELREVLAKSDDLNWGAFHGDRLVGTVDIRRFGRRRLAHVGILGMGIHPDYQGQGIGRRLMVEALRWADEAGLHRVELYVRADNPRARALYESAGFVLEGVRRDFVRVDGGYVDDCLMARLAQ